LFEPSFLPLALATPVRPIALAVFLTTSVAITLLLFTLRLILASIFVLDVCNAALGLSDLCRAESLHSCLSFRIELFTGQSCLAGIIHHGESLRAL